MTTPSPRLIQKATWAAWGTSVWRWIRALPIPASQKISEKAMTMAAADMTPKSSGVSKRARMRKMTGVRALLANSARKDHFSDWTRWGSCVLGGAFKD